MRKVEAKAERFEYSSAELEAKKKWKCLELFYNRQRV